MKKRIVLSNNEIREMECNEEFLNLFRGLGFDVARAYKNGARLTQDEIQEIDITIFEAFIDYDEVHCFSTHVRNRFRGLFANKINSAKAKKNDSSQFEMINLDYTLNSNKGDAEHTIHDVINDQSVDIEKAAVEKDFIEYIKANLNPIELDLLAYNLKLMKLTEVGEKYGKSKTNISNHNIRFKKKLEKLIYNYNR